jgi:hypothetical protein
MTATSHRMGVVPLAESPATKIQDHIESNGAFQVTLETRGQLRMEFAFVGDQELPIKQRIDAFTGIAKQTGARSYGYNAGTEHFHAHVTRDPA